MKNLCILTKLILKNSSHNHTVGTSNQLKSRLQKSQTNKQNHKQVQSGLRHKTEASDRYFRTNEPRVTNRNLLER